MTTSSSSGGCWPTTTHRLLLGAALREPLQACKAWAEWRSGVDLDAIDPASVMLLPLVYRRLTDRGVFGGDETRLRGVYRHSWARNQRRLRIAARVIATLGDNGIETLALKGIALGTQYYRDPGVRAMQDIDLAVRPTQVYRAVATLGRAGWRVRFPPFPRERRRAASTPLEDPHGADLDLHWHVLAAAPAPEADMAFWRDARVTQISGRAVRTLDPAHELVHIVTHGLQWNPINSLRWIADAVTLLRAEPALDWDRAIDLASRLRLAHPLRLGVEYVKREFEAPVPEDARRRLAALPVRWSARTEWWARMQGPGLPGGPVRYAVWSWQQYRRMRRDGAGDARPGSFPQFLRDYLRIPTQDALAAVLVREALKRLR